MPKKTLADYDLNDRKSMQNIIRPKNVFKELEEESSETLNDKLMKYKEFKMIFNKLRNVLIPLSKTELNKELRNCKYFSLFILIT